MHFEQLHTSCVDLCMGKEGGSIIQHRLFDGFSPEVSGFSSLTPLELFPASTDPPDINSVTNWTASVFLCVFCKQQASSGQLSTWLISYRDFLGNLLGIVCVYVGLGRGNWWLTNHILSNEANIIQLERRSRPPALWAVWPSLTVSFHPRLFFPCWFHRSISLRVSEMKWWKLTNQLVDWQKING